MWRGLMGSSGEAAGSMLSSSSSSSFSLQKAANNNDMVVHTKRVSQILRYISTLQTTTSQGGQFSFVRSVREHSKPFYADGGNNGSAAAAEEQEDEYGGVLFSIYDFQKLASLAMSQEELPFSFYTTDSKTKTNMNALPRKRTAWGATKATSSISSSSNHSSSCCWLRLTRMNSATKLAKPSTEHPQIQQYLKDWGKYLGITSSRKLLTLENLQRPPPTSSARVGRFVRQYTRYLQQKQLQKHLEPIYNCLFEWYHSVGGSGDSELDLVWGLGQALMETEAGEFVDGPLLEVKVEVELARDGALLVRPKQHTGVSWNRSVLNALQTSETTALAMKQWNQLVEALDPCQDINPAEPSTYIPFLKQMAVECCSGGIFMPSSASPSRNKTVKTAIGASKNINKLVVTDAWCLYASPRPSAVWARDALNFSENPTAELPRALWALTHGPGAVMGPTPVPMQSSSSSWSMNMFRKAGPPLAGGIKTEDSVPGKCDPLGQLHFPLPTSEAQNRIAELLLVKNYPAVVCEGPPGTGKTHTIANIVCACLCQGKRVLVTSKGAPALSVLRERLPACVQELCVDVSMSESVGMRQLQQTVERLANKVSWIQSDRETRRAQALQEEIEALRQELSSIDQRLRQNAEQKRAMVQTQEGQEFFETSLRLIEKAPWLMKTIVDWNVEQVIKFVDRVKQVAADPKSDSIHQVTGFPPLPSDDLISCAASRSGAAQAYVKNMAMGALAAVPWLGSQMFQHYAVIQAELDKIRINGHVPSAIDDWKLVVRALEKERNARLCCREYLDPLIKREGWPADFFYKNPAARRRRVKADSVCLLEAAATVKKLQNKLLTEEKLKEAEEVVSLDARRTAVSTRIQHLSEDLVACRVVAELSKNFTAEAQSALVKFAQVSGKSKFGKSSTQSKMTQRQKRKRQEYLDAFEKCVRYIPCWILTSSQISSYLPAEPNLFDLVVIDEASQSDVTVLPGLLRGKQWLVVGDTKQVSPTESFVAEEQIEILKSALPESPFESSMLPGHSFFDLCSQAFPLGRVILREHFRCAPEIISYSNTEFYNDNLVPLRLPTKDERLSPSLKDVRLPNGRKIGKVNPAECNEIVRMIKEYVESCTLLKKRTIGVISLVGEEQSRLIRGRLLDNIGPHKYKLHDILVGEPPSFQGAERDIVFLSLVCSPGSVVTQNQQMHAQRVNVALSRARDRMVLVRSFDANHIPNDQDIKHSVLDFFAKTTETGNNEKYYGDDVTLGARPVLSPFRFRAEQLLEHLLKERGFTTRTMGVVWENAICVEDAVKNTARAAICIEATGENEEEWSCLLEQQKSIERVGWKCLRVDGSSFLTNHFGALCAIESFLASAGIESARPAAETFEEDQEEEYGYDDGDNSIGDHNQANAREQKTPEGGNPVGNREVVIAAAADQADAVRDEAGEHQRADAEEEVVVITSDDEKMNDDDEEEEDCKTVPIPDPINSLGNGESAADYGNIADLGFLRRADSSDFSTNRSRKVTKVAKRATVASHTTPGSEGDLEEKQGAVANSTSETFEFDDLSQSSASEDGFDVNSVAGLSRSSRNSKRQRTRLDKYSRDARCYPSRRRQEEDLSYEEYVEEVLSEQEVCKDTGTDDADKAVGDNQEERHDDSSYVEE